MKKIVATLLMISLAAITYCQLPSASDAVTHSPSCLGTGVIVRNYNSSSIMVHHVDAADAHRHHFALTSLLDSVGNELDVHMGSRGSDIDTTYRISDMQILGGTCYFCGCAVIDWGAPVLDPWGNIIVPRYQNVGMIGRFSVLDMANSQPDVHLALVPNTNELTQMAVRRSTAYSQEDYELMISAIGVASDGGRSFVVEAGMLSPTNWRMTMTELHTNVDNEVFTDIVSTDLGTYISSELNPTARGNAQLRMHYSSWGSFYDQYYAYPATETSLDYDLTTGVCGWGWNGINSEIRMCEMRDGSLGLAFGTSNQQDGREGIAVATYYSWFMMSDVSVISSPADADIIDLAYSPFSGSLGICQQNATDYDGCVYSYLPGAVGLVHVVSMPGVRIQSVSQYGTQWLVAGGYEVLTSQITNLWKRTPIGFARSCMNGRIAQAETSCKVTDSKSFCDWDVVEEYPLCIYWTPIRGEIQPTDNVRVCLTEQVLFN